jgi:hypothetical protein
VLAAWLLLEAVLLPVGAAAPGHLLRPALHLLLHRQSLRRHLLLPSLQLHRRLLHHAARLAQPVQLLPVLLQCLGVEQLLLGGA